MKKIILSAFCCALILVACTPKTSKSVATTTSATTNSTTPTAGPSAPVSLESSEEMVTAGKTKFPDLTLDILKKGQAIYNGACTNCHKAKSIVKRDEQEWVGILDKMSPKAKLLAEEKDAVWKYIMSVKLAAK